MQDFNRLRTHKLIGLGGLVSIAKLDHLDRPLVMGLLDLAKEKYYLMTEKDRKMYFERGLAILQGRKPKKPRAPKKVLKFWEKKELEPWMTL